MKRRFGSKRGARFEPKRRFTDFGDAPPECARYKAAVGAKNLLTNPDFTRGPTATNVASDDWKAAGAPAGWNFWQEDFSKGAFTWDESAKATKASGVRAGVFLQQIPVTPGATYYVAFRAKTQGKGVPSLALGWKIPEVKWRHDLAPPTVIRPVAEADGWKVYGVTIAAPAVAGFMVFQLGAIGQPSEADRMWFDDACVIEMPKTQADRQKRTGRGGFPMTIDVSETKSELGAPDARKAEAVKNGLSGPVSNLIPASILQTHAGTTVYLDKASASLL